MNRLRLVLLAGAAFACAGPVNAQVETVFGLTTNSRLLTFTSAAPGTIVANNLITGLQGGEALIGIDYRPSNATMYGVSSQNRLYTINATTAAATLVGTLSLPLSGVNFGTDFNPVPDLIRSVSNNGANVRINPTSAAVTADTGLTRNGGPWQAVGAAYTNNFPGATTTQLFYIDAALNILMTTAAPNGGVLTDVGPLGFATSDEVGFDISGLSARAFASLTPETGAVTSSLYQINLTTGAATLVGAIGTAANGVLIDMTIAPVPEPTSLALVSLGVAGAAYLRRRKR